MDIILYNIITAIICLIIGYFFGSIPTAVWIGKALFHKDIREYGSKNAGGTNAGRVFGKKIGALVITLDVIKCYAPVWAIWAILTFVPFGEKPLMASTFIYFNDAAELSKYTIQWPIYWLVSIGVLFGHCYPIFAQFKGGKGVSTFAALVGCSWLLLVIYLISFLLILKWKKYVSLSSILTSIISVILSWIWAILLLTNVVPNELSWLPMMGWTLNGSFVFAISITLGSILLIFRHKGNIKRIRSNCERKITWMK